MSITDERVNPDGDVLWYWYENNEEYHKQNTGNGYGTAIRTFQRWLAAQGEYSHECHWTDIDLDDVPRDKMIAPRNITNNEAEKFLKDLNANFEPGSSNKYISTYIKAYGWLAAKTTDDCVSGMPFDYVLNVEDKDIIDAVGNGREAYIIPIEDARYYIRSWDRPKWSCINQIMAKYTRRAGGVSNLDFQDFNIDHPACQWTVHPDIRHWDDHVMFRPDKVASEPGRKSGNKTASKARYPLDDELKQSLLWYLATRPKPDAPTDPFFLDAQYSRLAASSIHQEFTKRSKEITQRNEGPTCWYGSEDGSGDDDNINPHYWRHWATTWYQDDDRVDQAFVDYMRGDAGDGSSANYNQYTDGKKLKILEVVPKFFEPFIDD
jgi:integrase